MQSTIYRIGIAILFLALGFQSTSLFAQNYDNEWNKIDSLTNKGLPESALKETEALFEKIKKDTKNPNQTPLFIKTLIYINKFQSQLEEEGLVKAIYRFQTETEKATGTTKAILESMLAEMYQQFLANNLYKFKDRTAVSGYKPEDIQTWDIPLLTDKVYSLYMASLANKDSKLVKLSNFKTILNGGFEEALTPTLYDLLAQRALAFFSNENTYLTQPAYKFYIEQEQALKDAQSFVNYSFKAKDSLSMKFRALTIYQELLRFHLADADPSALIDADIKRLQFVYQNCILENKDPLYLASLETLAKKHSTHPSAAEVLMLTAYYYVQQGSKYQPSPEETYRWELKKAYDICVEIEKKYPKSFGAEQATAQIYSLKQKSISLQSTGINPINKPILAKISYKNISKLHLKIVSVNEQQMIRISELSYDYAKLIDYLNDLPVLKKWSENLKQEGDFQSHQTEIKIPSLEKSGSYILLASEKESYAHQENGVAYTFLNLSNISFLHRNNQGKQEYYLTDRTSGKPQQGIKAEFYVSKYNSLLRKYERRKIGEAISDANGHVSTEKLSAKDYYSFYAKFTLGNDVLYLENSYYNYLNRKDHVTRVNSHFFLDRAIYRPGQTVYFKGIVIESDANKKQAIRSKYSTEIAFYDANYQEIARQKVTTNEYGSYQGNFTAPSTGLLGQMFIKDLNSGSTKYFRVEEYKRPKFEVSFTPLDVAYKLNDKVTVKGEAKAYAGSNIDGAKVQYRVVREVRFPYWYGWYRGWNPWARAAQEIVFGETTTDEKGEYKIEFTAIPDRSIPKEQKPEFSYTVYVDVTDITGETHSSQSSVRVGYIALSIGLTIPENILRESFSPIEISTNNLNGVFEAATGSIKIEQLEMPKQVYTDRLWALPEYSNLTEEEFKTNFPQYSYRDENQVPQYKVQKLVLENSFNTKNSKELQIPDIKNWPQGSYKLTLNSQDKFGEKIELIRFFTIYSENEKTTPNNQALFLANKQLRAEPGEKLSLDFGSFNQEAYLLFELEHEGKIVRSEWIQPKGRTKVELNIEEKHRGNFHFHLNSVQNNQAYTRSGTITVPWTNKELTIEYSTFRDKLLPGQEEEWQIKISGSKKDKVAAEVVAAMYDASLDAFAANYWALNLYPSSYATLAMSYSNSFTSAQTSLIQGPRWNENFYHGSHQYTDLNWFGLSFYDYRYDNYYYSDDVMMDGVVETENLKGGLPPPPPAPEKAGELRKAAKDSNPSTTSPDTGGGKGDELEKQKSLESKPSDDKDKADFSDVQVRTNLNETVFFFPQMQTDAEGNIILKFKMNEALTRWNFLLLAHTKDLKIGSSRKSVVTQKDLMVMPNPPRFLRQNDDIYFTAKVSNLTDSVMTGQAVLQLYDAISMKPIDADFGNTQATVAFTAKEKQSAPLVWRLKVPDTWTNSITYRVIAKSGNFSDGEESSLPVLTNRMLVTESMPLPVRGGQTKSFSFTHMKEASKSTTLRHHKYTLEFTPNPAWYAIQALPYMMEYPYECTEQIFARYYANSLASSVANAHPKIKKVFDTWKNIQPDALKSNLSKNQELKYALLEETPWVLNAQSEEQQKRNLGVLFDLNRMSHELDKALDKMTDRQLSNGGFSWFPGDRDSWYITQYIVEGMGHLDQLGVKEIKKDNKTNRMLARAVAYTDQRFAEHYQDLLNWAKRSGKEAEYLAKDNLDYMAIHYLYARSFFLDQAIQNDLTKKAVEYYSAQAAKYWLSKSNYMQGMLALGLHRMGKDKTTPSDIVKSLRERALKNEEMGMYWKYPSGYFWYELPIETHALLIEVFDVVANDAQAVDELKTWLLKAKQTTNWKTTKATAAACYALLRRGDNWLMEDQEVNITIGGKVLDQSNIQKEAGTGYFKTSWDGKDIKAEMSEVIVENPNKVVSWGAVYWQYFEQLDKITHFKDTPLKLTKKLFKEVKTDRGPKLVPIDSKSKLEPGDLIKVRIELNVDRDMEYVHMKDMRASGFEPTNVLSQYKYQGGLGYYESTRDASTNFFFSYLSKGFYVFEYPLRVNHKGDFSNGITTIQCMYAPEFTAHSEGIRVKVE